MISMLPPPTALRFSNRARSWLRLRSCSGDVFASGSGVIVSVPRTWAYAYRMSSVFDTGKEDENAVRGGLRCVPVGEVGGGPCPRPS